MPPTASSSSTGIRGKSRNHFSECGEFILRLRDDLSWRGTAAAATLFDSNGNPKPAAYEVAARLQNYVSIFSTFKIYLHHTYDISGGRKRRTLLYVVWY
jgi:hypothetical protein